MSILSILHYPDKRLSIRAQNVTTFDDKLQQLVNDMSETMYKEDGVGLAATQVGVSQRITVIDVSDSQDQLQVFINPEIINHTGSVQSKEGCLSVPDIYETVDRFDVVSVKYQDVHGVYHEIECHELLSRCIQHEIDHLNGQLFIEHLSPLKQSFIKKKYKKLNS